MKSLLENFIKKHLTQEIPTTLSYCEFDCRRLSCTGCPLNSDKNVLQEVGKI